jgi:hypothetical protein
MSIFLRNALSDLVASLSDEADVWFNDAERLKSMGHEHSGTRALGHGQATARIVTMLRGRLAEDDARNACAAGRLAEEATAADSTSALDTFAGQAMQGWLASYSASQVSNHPARVTGMAGIIAKDSYVVAEAMVREQSKRTNNQWSTSSFCRKDIAEDTGLGLDVINRVFDACEKRSTK